MTKPASGPVRRKKLPFKTRCAVETSTTKALQLDKQFSDRTCPFLIRPYVDGLRLSKWAAENHDVVQGFLKEHGALLFRDFVVDGVSDFEHFVMATSGELLPYIERSSPRSQVGEKIYTSTVHPADQEIFLHNEQSYNNLFPLRICFYCITPAPMGGETPIADCRRVYDRLDASLRRRFAQRNYQLVRNYGGALGLSWQEAFQTTDRNEVEAYCTNNGIKFTWLTTERLTTRQICRTMGIHPETGDAIWFNHLTFFHVSTLADNVREALTSGCSESTLPYNVYYGDGTPIEADVLNQFRAAYLAERIVVPWSAGDVLLLDNMRMAHGRLPYSGLRKVVVAMARPYCWSDVTATAEASE